MILDQTANRAQTHALILAPGAYSALNLPVPSSAPSAAVLSSWLQSDFVNPDAPLGSLEILVSPNADTTAARPTGRAMAEAVGAWLERAGSHPDNIAIFYFSGHAVADQARGDQLLVPDDASTSELGEVVSCQELLRSLDACPANRQLVIIDASWTPTTSPYKVLSGSQPRLARSTPVQRGVLRASDIGQAAYAPGDGGLGFLTQALMDVLRPTQSASPIMLRDLVEVQRRTAALAGSFGVNQKATVELTSDFALHYPPGSLPNLSSTPPEPPSTPPPAPPAPRAKAAAPTRARKPAAKPGRAPSPEAPSPMSAEEPAPQGPTPQASTLQAADAPAPPPDLDFHDDDAELDADALSRAGLAIMIARRLHAIWRNLNVGADAARSATRASFVMHLDAPWGGGKTTFANFVARTLNPYGFGRPGSFLVQRYGAGVNLSAAFAQDPPAEGGIPNALPLDAARPWIVVPFNAWQMEHCAPPWWAFYQAMHEACFRAIRDEGDRPVSTAREGGRRVAPPWARWGRWLWLWGREYLWRLVTPKLVFPLIGFVLSALVFLAMKYEGVTKLIVHDGATTPGLNPTSEIGLILLALTGGLTVIGGAISLFVESLAPGVNPLAERLGLGGNDPLARFRRHFQHTMARIKRPVLVVVDDLDRCKPETIVDLVRGMQTILRSPRVVFLILGDRDWIERAFEARNADMAKVGGGDEQSLGARFVEKAIQMSFRLPDLEEPQQSDYVRGLLQGRGGGLSAGPQVSAIAEVRLRERARAEATRRRDAPFDAQAVRDEARASWDEARVFMDEVGAGVSGPVDTDAARRIVGQIINEELAIQAASAPEVENQTGRRLQSLAPWLPPNPRQIKRILNGVALYHGVALQHERISAGGHRWFQLALWVTIMTEWPTTWRLLGACPELVDVITHAAPEEALTSVPVERLPGSFAATLQEVQRICADPRLMALIAAKGRPDGVRLDTAAVRELLSITPLQGRAIRLAEPPAKAEAAKAETAA